MPVNYSFDATQFEPVQSIGGVPPGKYPFTISDTSIEQTKDGQGGMFKVTFTTPVGMIFKRYNIWNQSVKAVEIAHKELSALCYAVGVFKLDFNNDGAALRNAQGMIEVAYQKGENPAENPDAKGYTEVKKVLDRAGNEPGKPPAQQTAAPAANAVPAAPQQGNGWGNTAPQQQAMPLQQPANAAPAAPQGWQPGPSNSGAPPWAK